MNSIRLPNGSRVSKRSKPGIGNGIADHRAASFQPFPPVAEVVHLIGDVRFGRQAVETVLRAEVELLVAHFEPEAAAPRQRLRLVDLAQAQHPAVKGASASSAPFGIVIWTWLIRLICRVTV